MKKITVNVWGGKECAVGAPEKLTAAGCVSAKIVPPWNVAGQAWAFEVTLNDAGLKFDTGPKYADRTTTDLTVGWLLGVIGTPIDVTVEFAVVLA